MSRYRDIDWRARVQAARALAAPCVLCEIRCGVDRLAGEQGRCGLAADLHVYSQMLHFGEEVDLVPSWVVNLSGCSMHCTFCSEDKHLRPPFSGRVFSGVELAEHLAEVVPKQVRPARNINFVGGEPSISLHILLETAEHLARIWPEHPPLLLNTNGYMTPEALALCWDVFEIFVVDLKFGPATEGNDCGWSVGKVKDYWPRVTARIEEVAERSGTELYIRHLLMPGHIECCTRPVLRWLAKHVPEVKVNVMSGFVVFGGTRAARHWGRSLSEDEMEKARVALASSGIEHKLWNGGPMVA